MATSIHPTAIVDPKAELGEHINVGPYVVIDGNVRLGDHCQLGPHVYLTGHTQIGKNNTFHAGCVIGGPPQDISYRDEPTKTIIGDRNTFREHVTIHRSNSEVETTEVGSENFLMASSHVGHNARLGNQNVLANGTLIAGHAIIADKVIFGGNTAVHQFVRIGRLAMLQGNSAVSQDLPPFLINSRVNELSGLNVIGLRRAGIDAEDRQQLKRLYHLLFRQGHPLNHALKLAKETFKASVCRELIDFISASQRGICNKLRR